MGSCERCLGLALDFEPPKQEFPLDGVKSVSIIGAHLQEKAFSLGCEIFNNRSGFGTCILYIYTHTVAQTYAYIYIYIYI